MARAEKLIEKMLRLPAEMRFNEVIKVVEFFDWKLNNVDGSHFYYCKQNSILCIVKHKNKVMRTYLKRVIDFLNLEEWYEKQKK